MTNKVVTLFAGIGFGALATALISNVNTKKKCKTCKQSGGKKEEKEEEKEEEEKEEEKEKKEKKHYDKLCSELENKEEKNVCNSFYFILLNRNKSNSKKDISTASFIAKKVFLEELEKKKDIKACRFIALRSAERYLQKKLPSGGSVL